MKESSEKSYSAGLAVLSNKFQREDVQNDRGVVSIIIIILLYYIILLLSLRMWYGLMHAPMVVLWLWLCYGYGCVVVVFPVLPARPSHWGRRGAEWTRGTFMSLQVYEGDPQVPTWSLMSLFHSPVTNRLTHGLWCHCSTALSLTGSHMVSDVTVIAHGEWSSPAVFYIRAYGLFLKEVILCHQVWVWLAITSLLLDVWWIDEQHLLQSRW